MATSITRAQVLGFRVRAQQLDRETGRIDHTSVLDIGAQDSGADGALWALANRGVVVDASTETELAMLWTVRGAPHLYRRADLPSVAAAVAPFSEADAARRVYDAARPLKAAGIPVLTALDAVAAAMRSVVTAPTAKGTVSGAVATLMNEPYLRFCRSCNMVHLYEMPFRLAAVRAGLELQPGTSPPVLERIADFTAAELPTHRHDLVRAYLRLLGPATPRDVAGYLDAPVREIKDHWPSDAVEVSLDGGRAWILAADVDRLVEGPPTGTRLLGPFDLFLQARDRQLLMPEAARAKALWPVLGRPGAVLHRGEIVGTWRPRKSGSTLKLRLEPWVPVAAELSDAIATQARRLAEHRKIRFAGFET